MRCVCVVTLSILYLITQTVCTQVGGICKTPNGEWATCKSIYDCKIFLKALKNRNTEQKMFLQKSQCGYERSPLVCCGSQDNWSTKNIQSREKATMLNRSQCGYQLSDKIFGGTETAFDEFPWMALLEYRNASNHTLFACGGALISKRYILTAAHCITETRRIGNLVNVRLGEWDLRQEVDCISVANKKICNKVPQDFGIEEIIIHPDHLNRAIKGSGDIALIRLNADVTYSEFIQPICLPRLDEPSAIGDAMAVAGWGLTEKRKNSPVKLQVEIPIVDRSQCKARFTSIDFGSQICAGGVKGKDSCFGDSGGPLMKTSKSNPSQWYIEGVISFGKLCGVERWPAVYTNVSQYLDWIQENFKD